MEKIRCLTVSLPPILRPLWRIPFRYCQGNYPPALTKLIAKRKPFLQLEDFNKKGTKKDQQCVLAEVQLLSLPWLSPSSAPSRRFTPRPHCPHCPPAAS
jgi:hypothetical protein